MKRHRLAIAGLVVFAFVCAQGVIGQTAMGPLRGVALADADAPQPVNVMVGRSDVPQFQIAPPANFVEQPKTATFTINYLNAGEVNYFGDVCIGWPAEAKTAFTYAANIWGTLLNSSVPIKISACWANMGGGGLLGHGGARSYYKDFSGAPQSGTYYPVAIANALYGGDLNGDGTEEIVIAYNAQFTDWYFGTGTCPADKIDFIQVIMHEMCHGLGFIGSMSASGSTATWGYSGIPTIYDRFTENGSGTKLITYPSGSSTLYNQLVSGSVYFNGANANAANDGAKVKLYAPNPWKPGSSYAHLDEIFNGTANAMMTYSVNYGETIHNPGPVTLGILKDNGWTEESHPTPPVVEGSPVLTDYDGDRYADPGIFRSDGSWHLMMSSWGFIETASAAIGSQFKIQPGDFDGDRYSDPTLYDSSSGYWYFAATRYGYTWYYIGPWGAASTLPACNDFDGDRRADPMAYDSSNGYWYILSSRYGWDGHYYLLKNWGGTGYLPVCADFDGDRYGDPMAYSQSSGYWYILSSRYNYTRYYLLWFGLSGYTPLSGDIDGDGYADLAIYDKTTAQWYILLSRLNWDIDQVIGVVWDGSAR
ncbi:MAG: hypothetical protein WC381_02195 [Kiritimatiellia bacterium]